MSPFAHAVFTGGTTGLIMGFAARKWHSGYAVLAFFVGLLPAMFLHNRWNSMGGQNFLVEYFVVQVPIFLIAAAGIILLRVAEGKITRQRLLEYARAGWFTPAEVEMLATSRGRRQAVRWASSRGRGNQMKSFIKGGPRHWRLPGSGSSVAGTSTFTSTMNWSTCAASPPSGRPCFSSAPDLLVIRMLVIQKGPASCGCGSFFS